MTFNIIFYTSNFTNTAEILLKMSLNTITLLALQVKKRFCNIIL